MSARRFEALIYKEGAKACVYASDYDALAARLAEADICITNARELLPWWQGELDVSQGAFCLSATNRHPATDRRRPSHLRGRFCRPGIFES